MCGKTLIIRALLLMGLLASSGPFAVSVTAEDPAGINGQLKDTRPNIIVFLVDDLGWQDTSVPFSGEESAFQRHFRTPHIRLLADRGVRFENAYAHCVCSPTRTSIMTGQNPARHHVTNWTLYPDRDQSGKTSRLSAPAEWRKEGIQPQDTTLPGLLQGAGYMTIHCGKAHWGAVGTRGSDPVQLGFDVNIAGHSAGAPGSYQARENFGNNLDGTPKIPWGVPGLEKYYGTDAHLTDVLAIEACNAIDTAIDNEKPFFLYMAPYAVHTPIQPHPRLIDNYRGKTYPDTDIIIPDVEADYASMVEGYDSALGSILDRLRERNIADRTLILFTSDNGGLSVHSRGTTPCGTGKNTHSHPLREGKGSAYEGGIRVPMIVSWATPDSGSKLQKTIPVTNQSVSRAHVISEDLLPTICHWAGATIPANVAGSLDGIDITGYLIGNEKSEPGVGQNRPMLFHYPHVWGPKGDGYQPHSSLRLGKWKIIYFYDTRQWELYNLESDIGETTNMADSQPETLATLKARLRQELTVRKAQYPTHIETGRPQEPE